MGVKNVAADEIAKDASDGDIRNKMFPSGKARDRNGGGRSVEQNFHPSARILVGNHRGHGPGEENVAGGKSRVEGMVLKEAAVAVAFGRAFATSDQLHSRIEWKGVKQRFRS